MGRAEVGSAKYQSKQLKASGLQKLKYYCQICQKQCRDANGFKNHLAAPSHHYRVKDLSDSGRGNQVIEEYSRQLKSEFLRLLKINHGTKKINANKFYQEYILSDRNHVHMNSTKWNSLTAFVKHLGTSGDVRVENGDSSGDSSELNLEIAYIDRSDYKDEKKSKEKSIKTDEEMTMRMIQKQMERAKSETPETCESSDNHPVHAGPVKLTLSGARPKPKVAKPSVFGDSDSDS